MNARCTTCSKSANFRNQRGNRLADYRCACGGKYEIVSGQSYKYKGEELPAGLEVQNSHLGPYLYLHRNRKGDVFYYDHTTKTYKSFTPNGND